MSKSDDRPCFIYAITHLVSGRRYIGSTLDPHYRWIKHRSLLNTKKHHCAYLQNAWNKYGVNAFEFRILLKLKTNDPIARARAELTAISENNIFNSRTAALGLTNFLNSEETRLKIRLGLIQKMKDPEHREWLRKRGEALAALWDDPNRRPKHAEAIRKSWKNPKRRASTSKKLKAHWAKDGVREEHAERVKLHRSTPEARKKNSETTKALWADPSSGLRNRKPMAWKSEESKKRHSEKLRARWASWRAARRNENLDEI